MCVCTVLGNGEKKLAEEFAVGAVVCSIVPEWRPPLAVNLLSVKSMKFSGVS